MTDASLRRLARLAFPGVTSRARIVYTAFGVDTVRLPLDLLKGFAFVHADPDVTRVDFEDVRITHWRSVHRGKRRREFYWGYATKAEVLLVARP